MNIIKELEDRAVIYTDGDGRAFIHGEMNEEITIELQEIQNKIDSLK